LPFEDGEFTPFLDRESSSFRRVRALREMRRSSLRTGESRLHDLAGAKWTMAEPYPLADARALLHRRGAPNSLRATRFETHGSPARPNKAGPQLPRPQPSTPERSKRFVGRARAPVTHWGASRSRARRIRPHRSVKPARECYGVVEWPAEMAAGPGRRGGIEIGGNGDGSRSICTWCRIWLGISPRCVHQPRETGYV